MRVPAFLVSSEWYLFQLLRDMQKVVDALVLGLLHLILHGSGELGEEVIAETESGRTGAGQSEDLGHGQMLLVRLHSLPPPKTKITKS